MSTLGSWLNNIVEVGGQGVHLRLCVCVGGVWEGRGAGEPQCVLEGCGRAGAPVSLGDWE
jgi:hypothetical protein